MEKFVHTFFMKLNQEKIYHQKTINVSNKRKKQRESADSRCLSLAHHFNSVMDVTKIRYNC